MIKQTDNSVLFITLDSCRYDTFANTSTPVLDSLGTLYKAQAPGNFTYASHMAMFMGFTPGDASKKQVGLNPKYGKIFRMSQGGIAGKKKEHFLLNGKSIMEGFKRKGYRALGTGAVAWFNPETEPAQSLIGDFDDFFYAGSTWSLPEQLAWIEKKLAQNDQPVFLFLNIGETHVPYYFQGAAWSPEDNPCKPFSNNNDRDKCEFRQSAALSYVDQSLGKLLECFAEATTIVCADHGDCWGEDGLWEHGISHEKVLDVPLLFRISSSVL